MARMIPAEIPVTTASPAEVALFPVLKDGLSQDFTVFHSFNLLTRNRENKFIDGEIDFLIFSAQLGFLVLEAKSGSIIFDGNSGRWYQNDRVMDKSPFEQARFAMYQLKTFFESRLGAVPQAIFAYAVCFPDVFQEEKILPSGAEPEIFITGSGAENIEKAVERVFGMFSKTANQPLTKRDQERIRHLLMPYCEYGSSLVDKIEQANRRMFALTEAQCRLLDFLGEHREVLVEGCAGSGKTIMALKKARELARVGKMVLLLAYNQMIGEFLTSSVTDLPNITASTYHRFCFKCLRDAGRLPPVKEDDQNFWEKEIPEAFAALIDDHPLKFDAIIIDEGQDFTLEYWVTIQNLRKPGGLFYIFYDPDQNVFVKKLEFPITGEPFLLNHNCRNSSRIFDAVKLYKKGNMQLVEGAPVGENIVEVRGETERNRKRLLNEILYRLIREKGLKSEQVVILGAHSLVNTCIGKERYLGNFIIAEGNEVGPDIVHYHTYMKFKGCESDAVILLDVNVNDPRWNSNALYTAISRARYLLYVIRSD